MSAGADAIGVPGQIRRFDRTVASRQIGLLARIQVATGLAYQRAPACRMLRALHGIVTPAD